MKTLSLTNFKEVRDLLSKTLDWLLVFAFFVIIVLTILQVILRYFFHESITGAYEILRFIFIYTSTLGAAVLLQREEHVQVGLIVNLFPDFYRTIAKTFKHLILALLHGYLVYLTFNWIQATGGFPSNVLRIPLVFIKISLSIGFALAAIYELGFLYGFFREGEL